MIYRFHWQQERRPLALQLAADSRPRRKLSIPAGWRIVTLFTVATVVWITYHGLGQPTWLRRLPQVVQELIALTEGAALLAVLALWGLLVWRHRTARQDKRSSLAALSVAELYSLTPAGFERYVAGLFRQKGYQVRLRGSSGDMGVDLELLAPGQRRAIVQCKRYQNTVGAEIVRELYGTLIHERAQHAFLVTTADISEAAREWAGGKPITLIDGATLAQIAAKLAGVPA